VLLPQYSQIMLGYTAELAGEALSPGGLAVMALMPLVGVLIGRVEARKLLAFGFSVLSLSLFYMASHMYIGMDFPTVVKLRIFQSCGLAFMFVPINTLSYVGVPLEKNNSVSGIVNLSRNMGGDIGIAFVTTMLARRTQMHQSNLSAYADPYHRVYDIRVQGIAAGLHRAGYSEVDSSRRALGIVYRQLQQQAMALSYIDVLFLLGCFTASMLPLLFLLKANKPGKPQMGH